MFNIQISPEVRAPLFLSSIKATSFPRLFRAVHWGDNFNNESIHRKEMLQNKNEKEKESELNKIEPIYS